MDIQKELIAEYDREVEKTRKMLEAIPDNADLAFAPHPKSMPLGRLAGHLTDMTGDWALNVLTQDKLEFAADHKWDPYVPANKASILEKFGSTLAKVREALAATKGERWDQHWKFIFGGQTWIDETRYEVFRNYVLDHLIHHRAQLSVYIRLVGGKVPGTFGPSADEM
ncbi:MAG TPA: DinB family protein [Terracidiphilus sp.]|nr:DinB family protein [Terracidiphilus sp.]